MLEKNSRQRNDTVVEVFSGQHYRLEQGSGTQGIFRKRNLPYYTGTKENDDRNKMVGLGGEKLEIILGTKYFTCLHYLDIRLSVFA